VRFVVQFQRADDLVEFVVVHPGVVAAAPIEAADLDAAAAEDPGARMTEIGKMIIVLRLSARIGHISQRGAAGGTALDDRLLDLGPERFSHSMSDCKARSGRIDSGVCFSNWQASTFR